jgi:D-aminoacyl-tRNA deacylase
MNRSLRDVGGALLVVSQFTLYGNCERGRRPSFDEAAPVEKAKFLCDYFVTRAREVGMLVETGVFQSAMEVKLVNDGPVTFVLESGRK